MKVNRLVRRLAKVVFWVALAASIGITLVLFSYVFIMLYFAGLARSSYDDYFNERYCRSMYEGVVEQVNNASKSGVEVSVYMEEYLDINRTRSISTHCNLELCFSDDSDVTISIGDSIIKRDTNSCDILLVKYANGKKIERSLRVCYKWE
jgi:hypothetical protein